MLRLLLTVLCALVLAHNVAWAEGEKKCTSITERDCAPLPRVSTGRDHRVEIFTRRRTIFFPVPQGEAGEELRLVCTNGKCACTEHVQFFEFKGPHRGFRQVNDAERRAASRTHCSLQNANVNRDALAFALSAHLISTAISELEYCHGCGGSCHGSTTLATYDEQDGRLLQVGDFLKPGSVQALREHMADYIAGKHGEDSTNRATLRTRILAELAKRALIDEGVYAERGTLYINLNSFALSCADGSFHPIPIPPGLIKPGLAGMLR
jgi:hypothetical protein